MLNIKSLIAATVLSGIAVASFAATPATNAAAPATKAVAPTSSIKVAPKPDVKHIKKVKATKAHKAAVTKPAVEAAK